MASRGGDLELPASGLMLLIGPSGSGKSSWARARFSPSQILESDAFRQMVADDATDQAASGDAFRLLHGVAKARCKRRLLAVVDATNLTLAARRALLRIASQSAVDAVAVVFDVSLGRCLANNARRAGRRVPEDVIRRHHGQLQDAKPNLEREGYAQVWWLGDGDISER